MQSKFRFSLDGVDATARQFAEVRRQLQELSAGIGESIRRVNARVAAVEDDFESLSGDQSQADADGTAIVVSPPYGGTGVWNVFDNPLSSVPRKTVYCRYDGAFGVDCSSSGSVVDVRDADEFVSVDVLRHVKWRMYLMKDDVNLKLDDAQPVVGLIAEDLDDAGLGVFCEYDREDNPVGVDYAKLSVAALRLAQEAMDEVEELRALVGDLSARIDRMGKASTGKA